MERESPALRFYVLGGPDGRTPVPAGFLDAAVFLAADSGKVAYTDLPGAGFVSTRFLATPLAPVDREPPLLFETMVYLGGRWSKQCRYATWAEAEAGHAEVVRELSEGN